MTSSSVTRSCFIVTATSARLSTTGNLRGCDSRTTCAPDRDDRPYGVKKKRSADTMQFIVGTGTPSSWIFRFFDQRGLAFEFVVISISSATYAVECILIAGFTNNVEGVIARANHRRAMPRDRSLSEYPVSEPHVPLPSHRTIAPAGRKVNHVASMLHGLAAHW